DGNRPGQDRRREPAGTRPPTGTGRDKTADGNRPGQDRRREPAGTRPPTGTGRDRTARRPSLTDAGRPPGGPGADQELSLGTFAGLAAAGAADAGAAAPTPTRVSASEG